MFVCTVVCLVLFTIYYTIYKWLSAVLFEYRDVFILIHVMSWSQLSFLVWSKPIFILSVFIVTIK